MFENDWFLSPREVVGNMRTYIAVLLVDALVLVALFYVNADWQWRIAYAASPHGHTSGYVPSFSYSLFTQIFTMSSSGVSLASPLTLDWIQVLGVALVIINGWYLYSTYAKRKTPPASPANPA